MLFRYSVEAGGFGVGSPRRMGLAWAACGRPSTAGLVTRSGSGTLFCCTAVLVQPRIVLPNIKDSQPMCRSFRAMSRFPLRFFVEMSGYAILPHYPFFG